MKDKENCRDNLDTLISTSQITFPFIIMQIFWSSLFNQLNNKQLSIYIVLSPVLIHNPCAK